MPNLYGYIRVSSQRQAQHGFSMEAQEAAIRRAFEYKYQPLGFTLAAIIPDPAESGRKPLLNRPGGFKLNTLLEPGDAVLFPKLDRGFRNTLDALQTIQVWEKLGVTVHLLDLDLDTSTPFGKAMITVMSAFAQLESGRIGERVKSVWSHRRQRRLETKEESIVTSSNPRYGYRTITVGGKKKWVPDEDQRELGAKIIHWIDDLGMSFQQVLTFLNKKQIWRYNKRGKPLPWSNKGRVCEVYQRAKRLQAEGLLAPYVSTDQTSTST